MQTSYVENDWNEDGTDQRLRGALNRDSAPDLVRKLYPLRAKVLADVPNGYALGFPAGYVFLYARTKLTPSNYPIEVWIGQEPGRFQPFGVLSTHHFASHEVALVMPAEGE